MVVKLVYYFEDNSHKLYNVVKDISEKEDLSAKHPEVAQELKAELVAWQKDTKAVIPSTINESFDAKATSEKGKKKKN